MRPSPPLRAALAALVLAGCGVREVERSPYVAATLAPVRIVAADPAGGPFGDAVAQALAARGVAVVPADEVRAAMAAAGVGPASVARLNGLGFLDGRGPDALLVVTAAAEPGGVPRRAAATLRRVPDGAILAEARWTPFWGDWTAGIADRAPVRDEGDAARALARELSAAMAR